MKFGPDNMLILPGFINAHCHLELMAIGPLRQRRFVPWIEELMGGKFIISAEGRISLRLTEFRIKEGIKRGLKQLADSGVTTVFDHVSYDAPFGSFNDPRIQIESFGEVVGSRPEVSREIYSELLFRKKQTPGLYITPHAIHTVPPQILKEIFQNEPKPFSIHLNESQEEIDYFQNRGEMWGMICEMTQNNGPNPHGRTSSAIMYCAEHHLSLDRCLIIHANYLSNEDIQVLKEAKDICVVHCPSSHAFFGHQPFPYERLRDAGIPVALGTDSVCSGSTLNMLDEIHLFWRQYPAITIDDMLKMVSVNALIPFGAEYKPSSTQIGFRRAPSEDIKEVLLSRKQIDWSGLV